MKSKQQKQQEAIARNEKRRDKYIEQCKKEHPTADVDAQNEYADMKIGIPAKRR